MPALVANYQKKVLETRIKKFYSVLNQTVNAKKAEDGDLDRSMLSSSHGIYPDANEEFFYVNYAPYMKTTSAKKKTQGFLVGFPDGSGMYLYSHYYIAWCVDYKMCDTDNIPAFDGKTVFSFWIDGNVECSQDIATGGCALGDRPCLLAKCKTSKAWCAAVIRLDGWEIKDDYPWQ